MDHPQANEETCPESITMVDVITMGLQSQSGLEHVLNSAIANRTERRHTELHCI